MRRKKRVKMYPNLELVPINYAEFISIYDIRKIRKLYKKGVRFR